MIVAVAGKGGVGKSTISALLVRMLSEEGMILAVDADPNSNLGMKLGLEVHGTIGGVREGLLDKGGQPPKDMSKQEYLRLKLQEVLAEGEGFDLLTMGRPEGPGCYCYVNNLLRVFVDQLMERYPHVIIDNEAGMEHLSRRTAKRMDLLLLVSDIDGIFDRNPHLHADGRLICEVTDLESIRNYIEEKESTLIVGEDARVSVDDFGFLWIDLKEVC